MSGRYHHERAEKICLNCEAALYGHFCHVCGQENNEPKESVWHLLRHFAEDITHFDGKFFASLKYVLFRPGYLATEYMKGRRASFLNPIRMYLLYSAIFFVLIFTFFAGPGHMDAVRARWIDSTEAHATDNFTGFRSKYLVDKKIQVSYLSFNKKYAVNGVHVYDSIQASLPATKKDDLVDRFFNRRFAAIATVYHKDPSGFLEQQNERFLHSFSKIFFFSLPVFFLLLALLYIRRKEYYMVAHAVFAIHYFCIIFIFGLPLALLSRNYRINDTLDWIILVLQCLILVGIYGYLYVALLRFYKQGWFKTLVKWLIQSVFFTVSFIIAVVVLYLNSMLSLAQ